MTRAVDLLKNRFGVSQLYKYDVKQDDEVILSVYWHPLTIAEREAIQSKSKTDDTNDYALQMMIEKALDKDGARLFQDGDKASLRREISASVLEEIQISMITIGADKEVKEAKADLKADNDWKFIFSLAKELHKTVAELCETLTIEEMIGWAAYAEIEHEELKKQQEQAQRSSALRGKRR